MDTRDREDLCNSAPDEETVAREKKRLRRVSFAEITSVHVFDRDEECDSTPSNSTKPSSDLLLTEPSSHPSEGFGFLRDFVDSDDSKELSRNEEDDDEEDDDGYDDNDEHRGLFVRPIIDSSSSPGSGFGSATSNDEENFFGPVSADFIRSGQLSNSGASDDKHELTLDSTAFSMHFRSLMQSDSEGNFKTPSRMDLHMTFEGKTGNSTPNNSGSSMALTGVNKPIPRTSLSNDKSSAGSGSNDMSLIGDNPHMYDYGRLSPNLCAILGESVDIMHDVSVSDPANVSKSPNHVRENIGFEKIDERTGELVEVEPKDFRADDKENHGSHDQITEAASDVIFEGNSGTTSNIINHTSYTSSLNTNDTLLDANASSPSHQNKSAEEPTLRLPSNTDTDSTKDVIQEIGGPNMGFGSGSNHTLTPLREKIKIGGDYESLGHVGDGMNKESLVGASCTPDVGFKNNLAAGSPLEGSVSSLGAKRRQIFNDTAGLSRSELLVTPFSGKPPRSSSKFTRSNASILSIAKNTSKLSTRESSHSGVGDEISKPVLSNYHCNSPSFAASKIETSKNPNKKSINVLVTNGGENVPIVPSEKIEEIGRTETLRFSDGTPRSTQRSRQIEEVVTTVQDREDGDKISAEVILPKFSTLGKEIEQQSFNDHNIIEDALVFSRSNSSSKTRFQETGTPHKSNSSLLKQLTQKLFTSPMKSIIQEAPMQQEQFDKLVSSGVGLVENTASTNHLSSPAELPINHGSSIKENIAGDTSLKEENVHDASTFIGNASAYNNVEKSKLISTPEFLKQNLPKESENVRDHRTPLGFRTTLRAPSRSPQMNSLTRTDPGQLQQKVLQNTTSYDSASPFIHSRTITPARLENRILECLPQVPCMNEPYAPLPPEKVNTRFLVKNHQGSPSSIQCSNGQVHDEQYQEAHILQESLPVQDAQHSGRKRRLQEIINMGNDRDANNVRIPKSPKIDRGHCFLENIEGEAVGTDASPRRCQEIINMDNDSGADNVRIRKSPKVVPEHCFVKNFEAKEIFSKLSGAIEHHLLPLAENLNLEEVCIVEDIVARVQKANKYMTLCNELQSQKIHDRAGNLQQKRVVEARCLQSTLVYEHAKLQLLRLRHKRALKKVELLHSGIEESRLLKKSFSDLCVPRPLGVQYNESHISLVSVNNNSKNKEAYDKLITKRQELGALDKKLKDLTKSLLSSCKIKGEPSSADLVVLINDHLKKRANSRFVRRDLQVWEVQDLESKNLSHNLVLNYCHFLHQWFTLNGGPVSSIVTLNNLIDQNIMKSFPNINACTAFAFVFNAKSTRTIGGTKKLALETQVTSFLLTNLLEVMEETNMAQIELRNLIETSFYSPYVEQLDLQLCFIDFKTGYKVTLTLDMASLNRGVYPSEIFPSRLQIHPETQTETTKLLSTEISAAIGALKAGHSRIIRICRCVSQVLKSRCV